MWAASDFLSPSLEKSVKVDSNWQTSQEWFKQSSEHVGITPGCINLSPAWYQQGHKVGSDEMVMLVIKLTNPIEPIGSRSIYIVEGTILQENPKIHSKASSHCISGTQGDASRAVLGRVASLRQKAEGKELPKMSETLQYWALVFNTLSIISNRQTPNHRDHLSIPECFDILTSVRNYFHARMSMPSLQLEFGYNSRCMIAFSGRIVRHGVHEVEGDCIAWAWYMRDSVHIYAGVPPCGWARVNVTHSPRCK
jgi:hypothetical protein